MTSSRERRLRLLGDARERLRVAARVHGEPGIPQVAPVGSGVGAERRRSVRPHADAPRVGGARRPEQPRHSRPTALDSSAVVVGIENEILIY